jgi:hypothetical protein
LAILARIFRKKTNEINEREPQTDHIKQKRTEKDKEASKQAAENDATRGLAGLNGAADRMLADVRKWMHRGDETSARNWLGNLIAHFGEKNVSDAWVQLGTEMASGKAIAKPLAVWSSIAQRFRDERQAKKKTVPRRY